MLHSKVVLYSATFDPLNQSGSTLEVICSHPAFVLE